MPASEPAIRPAEPTGQHSDWEQCRRASSPPPVQCQSEGMNSEHLPSFSLEGKLVVVTGASRGIGRGLVDALAAAGATVALTARSYDEASTIAAEVVAAGGRASGHVMDVADIGSINAAFDDIAQQHGRVDVLVANAGLGANHPAVDVTEADWDDMMDVNAKGLFFTAQAAGKIMLENGSGRIVAMSSQASLVGIPDHAVYCASKGAVNQLVRVLALEWGPHGITVNAVAPTFIYTPGTAERLDDPEFRRGVVDRIPMGDVGTIADVAGAVIYLASDAAAMVNGIVLPVDGGWTAQ
jgi:NAD(P)-dependent dehydrogenase (short-subunit alcohol dehydrogenase family)